MTAHFDWFAALAESPIFAVLVLCSVVTFGVVIERMLHYLKRRDDADRLLRDVTDRVRSGDLRGAAVRCDDSGHPLGPVARRLLDGPEALGSASDERLAVALSEQKLLLERNLGVLGTMAAIAPLIGLLGTVWGIMRAFGDMARVGSAAPSVVASGVAEALVTTAAGLVVAVPALVLHNHFARRANTMLVVTENHARALRVELAEFRVADPVAARGDHPGTPEPAGSAAAPAARRSAADAPLGR